MLKVSINKWYLGRFRDLERLIITDKVIFTIFIFVLNCISIQIISSILTYFNLDILYLVVVGSMAQINIETVQKNTDSILEIVGKQSYVNWEQFTQNSSEVARHIDNLNQTLGTFRQLQHKNFIQTMKKLKNYDLPDLLQAVKTKKLPKQALRGVLTRFKFNGDKLELTQPVETLRSGAKTEYESYTQKNNQICEQIEKFTQMLNKKIQETGFEPEKIPELQKIKSTVKFNISDNVVTKLASGIQIQYLPNTKKLIGIKTYTQLLDCTFTLIKDEYRNLTIISRKNQREKSKDHPEYLKSLNQFLNNCEALINEGQAALASKLGISEEKLGESEIAMMERNLGNNLIMLQSQLRGKIKESVKSEKDVSMQVAKQVIRYQVQMIDKKASQINSILKNLEKGPQVVQMVPMLLALILNDYVYEKYGYEEQDFMKNLGQQIMNNQQFVQIFRDMQAGIMKLMQRLDIIPPQVAEMMKQQQQYMNQMGGMMPPGMLPPGQGMMMPPGVGQNTNPLQMLQNQQMQQMQQMFQNMQPPK